MQLLPPRHQLTGQLGLLFVMIPVRAEMAWHALQATLQVEPGADRVCQELDW